MRLSATRLTAVASAARWIRLPSLSLNFSDPSLFDPRITFTRAFGAMRTNADGTLELVGNDVPRISYDSASGKMGLLIEEARTNLLTYSSEFDNAAWVKTNATVTANALTAPDGTLTADKLVEDTSTAFRYVQQTLASTAQAYTFSCFVKSSERGWCFVSWGSNPTSGGAWFNLSTGTVGTAQANVTSRSIAPAGNDWYRIQVTVTSSGATLTARLSPTTADNTPSYLGDGTSGLYIWGASLEQGNFPTSYIPTTSAAATRAADVPVMTGTNFSDWYNQTEGTFVVDIGPYRSVLPTSNSGLLSADDGTLNNQFRLFIGSGVAPVAQVSVSGVTQAYLSFGALTPTSTSRVAAAIKLNSVAKSYNGATAESDSAATTPTVTRLLIGNGQGGVGYLNGHIFSLRYYPQRLSNAQLQALSAP